MLTLFSALVAAVPPAAPLPILRAADHHVDELKQRAREVEEAIKDLHRELEEIERAIEREGNEQRGAARWIRDLGEQEGIFVVEVDGDSGREVMVDGDRSELIERLVEQLEGREGGDGEPMRRVLVGLGEGEPLIELGGDDAPGGVFFFETDGEEHDDDHHEGHREEHHDAHHHDEIVREFEFPGGHGEIRVEVDVHGIEGKEILEPLLEQLMGAELPMISAFDAPDGVVILEHHADHDGHEGHHHDGDHDGGGSVHQFEFPGGHGEVHVGVEMHGGHSFDDHGHGGELEEMLHELGIDLEDLYGHSIRHRMIRHGGEHGLHEEHHDEECEDDDGHHEDHDEHHGESSVHHFKFPGGHGEIHVGVEVHGDHGHDDHGHGGELEEMLHELGIDLDGREMHIEMEVESEDEHGHHVEHRVIRIGGEHGHHDEHDHDEECEDDDGHHEDHDEHHREMVREFEFPGGHGEVHVGVELHGDHGFDGDLEGMLDDLKITLDDVPIHLGIRQRMIRIGARRGHDGEHDHDGHHEEHHDDHGHGGDLEEMLHELGIDLDGREMHIEMEVESEDEHGHHVEQRVIRIDGEHGHHDEDDHDGHHEGHDGHPDGVIVIGPGLDRRLRWRSNAPVPIEFDLEELELGPGVVDLSRRADGRRRVRMERRRSDPRERREIMEGMRRRAMERRAQADRGGFPEEMQQALRELQEETAAVRREMNELRRRLDRR
jgi:hypothetical protein